MATKHSDYRFSASLSLSAYQGLDVKKAGSFTIHAMGTSTLEEVMKAIEGDLPSIRGAHDYRGQ